jgi:hypothetical protein
VQGGGLDSQGSPDHFNNENLTALDSFRDEDLTCWNLESLALQIMPAVVCPILSPECCSCLSARANLLGLCDTLPKRVLT